MSSLELGIRRGYLTVVTGNEVGRRYVVRLGQRFTLGRGQSVTIPLDDKSVSRRHACIELDAEGLVITDLGSRNGSFVDEERIPAGRRTPLANGVQLRLGDHLFDVECASDVDDDLAATRQIFLPTVPAEFEILGELGRGATGIVYAARQSLLNRRVAIKVPRVVGALEDDTAQRFLREARLQCRVDSPFVVSVHDIRRVGERTYLVLELVHGYSVKDRMASGPLPIHEVLRIGEYTARALDAVHQVDVVHRDVKPANILLTVEGAVKLSDFGIAKALDEDIDVEPLTGSGEGLGTLCYVAPEQAVDAKEADVRADVYSLGATLFHLIAGRPRIAPRTPAELMRQLSAGPLPKLQDACLDCPHDVAELIHHMMEPAAKNRPSSAALLASKLHDRWEHYYASSKVRTLRNEELKQTTEFLR